ncbi:MAG: 50S ribosomal protein L29 [Deltaproteobacteria bacterium]|nr:50S ribosomal protein L29 [Deltaproteobacteria bacterium]
MANNEENQVVAAELRKRGEAEIQSLLAAKSEELQKSLFKHELKQLRTTHGLKNLRRDIARLKTILNERRTKAKE